MSSDTIALVSRNPAIRVTHSGTSSCVRNAGQMRPLQRQPPGRADRAGQARQQHEGIQIAALAEHPGGVGPEEPLHLADLVRTPGRPQLVGEHRGGPRDRRLGDHRVQRAAAPRPGRGAAFPAGSPARRRSAWCRHPTPAVGSVGWPGLEPTSRRWLPSSVPASWRLGHLREITVRPALPRRPLRASCGQVRSTRRDDATWHCGPVRRTGVHGRSRYEQPQVSPSGRRPSGRR